MTADMTASGATGGRGVDRWHPRRPDYVALGDSYSSGEANPPFDLLPACDRSSKAWPNVLGGWLRWDTVNLACSGAKTGEVTGPYNGQPAQTEQLDALDTEQDPVEVVTIMIGGNDAGFGAVIGQCWLADCATGGGLAGAQAAIATLLPQRLTDTYRATQAAAPSADLVVVGYPRLLPSRSAAVTGCPWLGEAERVGLNRTADLLNDAIRTAAAGVGARYVDVSRSLRGHELCTADPWLYPLGLDQNTSSWAHPVEAGQRAIAARVAIDTWWLGRR